MIQSALIIGGGTMGSGIAQWFAQQHIATTITDNDPSQIESALKKIKASWDQLEKKGKFSTAQVASFKTFLTSAPLSHLPKNNDLILEAIVENLEIKTKLFKKIETIASETTIIASNTSSIPIARLAASSKLKKQILGIHFFNPATIMKLVELIPGPWTAPKTIIDLKQWFEEKGKAAAVCKDSPGFIVNRVARNFYGESLKIAAVHDEKKMQQIDNVMREVGGFKMGPFELMDLIGIDINYAVTQSVWESYYFDERFKPHALQRQMVESARLGRKTGEGFFNYD